MENPSREEVDRQILEIQGARREIREWDLMASDLLDEAVARRKSFTILVLVCVGCILADTVVHLWALLH